MKVLAITLALAGLASTATLNAQIVSNSRVTGTTQGATVNGSWTIIGRDGSGTQIYERRTRDSNGNIVVQRARRDRNGNMTIISTNTVNGGYNNGNNGGYNNGNNGGYNNGNNNCSYSQSTNSVGDIIFGRANANTCQDVNSRDDGAWYQVGQGANNNSIYERRTQDRNGNLVIQRARRNRNGSFTIISTRVAGVNDKQWKKAQRQQQRADNRQMKNDNHR
jgi:hypothetical protein